MNKEVSLNNKTSEKNAVQNPLLTTINHLNHKNSCSYCSTVTGLQLTLLKCNIHGICRKCFELSLSSHEHTSSSSSLSSRKNSDSKSCDVINGRNVGNEMSSGNNGQNINVNNNNLQVNRIYCKKNFLIRLVLYRKLL